MGKLSVPELLFGSESGVKPTTDWERHSSWWPEFVKILVRLVLLFPPECFRLVSLNVICQKEIF